MADYSKIPEELRASDHWLIAKVIPDSQRPSKLKKIPKSVKTGKSESWNAQENLAPFDLAAKFCEKNADHVLGYAPLNSPFGALDFDNAFEGEGAKRFLKPEVTTLLEKMKLRNSYKEISPSGNGLRVFFRNEKPADALSQHLPQQDLGNDVSVEAFIGGFVTVTGNRLGESSSIATADPHEVWSCCKRQNSSLQSIGSGGRNNELAQYAGSLAKKELSFGEISVLVREKNRQFTEPLTESELEATVLKSAARWADSGEASGPDSWRQGCKTLGQLSRKPITFLISGLLPEKCLTAVSAPSYSGKTWFALHMARALCEGSPLWGFEVPQALPVIYHVPEMNETWVHSYATTVGVFDTENFLFRAMEQGIWRLGDSRMMKACEGRVAFFDTQAYFNEADDSNAYTQAVKFGERCFELINAGCLGIVALFHLAKNGSRDTKGRSVEPEWTLENSIIGSAGYGAILRSCLRIKNLSPDANDLNVWLYVQGMKNPGLKPFQLEGPMPLKLKVPPGESPHLRELLSGDEQTAKVRDLLGQGKSQRRISAELKISLGKVNKMAQLWKSEKDMEI